MQYGVGIQHRVEKSFEGTDQGECVAFFFACEFEFQAITCAGLGQHGRQPAQGTGCLYSPKVFPKSRGEAWIGCDDVCMLHSILVQLDPARPGHEKMYLLKQIVRRVREEP